jgi:hypothetical protein
MSKVAHAQMGNVMSKETLKVTPLTMAQFEELVKPIQGQVDAHGSMIEAQLALIQAQQKLIEDLTGRHDWLKAYVNEQLMRVDALEEASTATSAALEALETEVEALKGIVNGYEGEEPEEETDEQRATRVGVAARVMELEHLLRGRNRSAPIKRNMTDDDARRVLTGDVKDLGHKEAGEVVGLTYASRTPKCTPAAWNTLSSTSTSNCGTRTGRTRSRRRPRSDVDWGGSAPFLDFAPREARRARAGEPRGSSGGRGPQGP